VSGAAPLRHTHSELQLFVCAGVVTEHPWVHVTKTKVVFRCSCPPPQFELGAAGRRTRCPPHPSIHPSIHPLLRLTPPNHGQDFALQWLVATAKVQLRTVVVPALWAPLAAFPTQLAAGVTPDLLPWTSQALLEGLEATQHAVDNMQGVLRRAADALGESATECAPASLPSARKHLGVRLVV
jgi:hypothetical protein